MPQIKQQSRRNTLCISRVCLCRVGAKGPSSTGKTFQEFARIKIIALQSVWVQCDPKKNPIYASFPTTVLTVSGSRVRATNPTLSRMHPAPRRLIVLRFNNIVAVFCGNVKKKRIQCRAGACSRRNYVILRA